MKRLILLLICLIALVGCDKGQYLDTGAIMVDKDLLPDNVKVE